MYFPFFIPCFALLKYYYMPASLRLNIENTIGKKIADRDYEGLLKLLFEKSYDKKDLILEEGRICNYIYFITEGSCYSFITDEEGEKNAIQFALENYWISDLYSFFSG